MQAKPGLCDSSTSLLKLLGWGVLSWLAGGAIFGLFLLFAKVVGGAPFLLTIIMCGMMASAVYRKSMQEPMFSRVCGLAISGLLWLTAISLFIAGLKGWLV